MKRRYELTGERFAHTCTGGDGIFWVRFFDVPREALVWRIGRWAYGLREVKELNF